MGRGIILFGRKQPYHFTTKDRFSSDINDVFFQTKKEAWVGYAGEFDDYSTLHPLDLVAPFSQSLCDFYHMKGSGKPPGGWMGKPVSLSAIDSEGKMVTFNFQLYHLSENPERKRETDFHTIHEIVDPSLLCNLSPDPTLIPVGVFSYANVDAATNQQIIYNVILKISSLTGYDLKFYFGGPQAIKDSIDDSEEEEDDTDDEALLVNLPAPKINPGQRRPARRRSPQPLTLGRLVKDGIFRPSAPRKNVDYDRIGVDVVGTFLIPFDEQEYIKFCVPTGNRSSKQRKSIPFSEVKDSGMVDGFVKFIAKDEPSYLGKTIYEFSRILNLPPNVTYPTFTIGFDTYSKMESYVLEEEKRGVKPKPPKKKVDLHLVDPNRYLVVNHQADDKREFEFGYILNLLDKRRGVSYKGGPMISSAANAMEKTMKVFVEEDNFYQWSEAFFKKVLRRTRANPISASKVFPLQSLNNIYTKYSIGTRM